MVFFFHDKNIIFILIFSLCLNPMHDTWDHLLILLLQKYTKILNYKVSFIWAIISYQINLTYHI